MARNRRAGKIRWIYPDIVFCAVMMQYAAMVAQVTLKFATVHAAYLVLGGRKFAH
jgi:hypothetical protein